MTRPVKLSTPDSFSVTLDRIDALADQLELSRSALVCRILESVFTEQMHFLHTIKLLEEKADD